MCSGHLIWHVQLLPDWVAQCSEKNGGWLSNECGLGSSLEETGRRDMKIIGGDSRLLKVLWTLIYVCHGQRGLEIFTQMPWD